MKRKIMIYVVMLVMLVGSIAPAYANAQAIPQAFWNLSTQYQKALEGKNHQQVIELGWQIIDLFKGKEDTKTAQDIITPRLEHIAKAYEALGEYEKSVETYKRYIPFGERQGWDDGVNYAKAKIQSLSYSIELYVKTTDISKNQYFGAKYEPKAGVYFGSTYDKDPRIGGYRWEEIQKHFPKKNTAYLIYLDWGTSVAHKDRFFKDAKENAIAVELAWNTYDSEMKKNIESHRGYIEETAKHLKQIDIPIFLRFSGEMNLEERGEDPVAYVKAFQYVSKIMKKLAPNVAMVWSPNDISQKGRSYGEYYPGDAYVDWVGLSSYTDRYFQGKKDWGNLQDTIDSVYFTGDYANPLAKIKPFIEFLEENKINKPMLLTENGVAHYAKHEKEDVSEWAKIQLQRLYIYGPMIYPRLKGMFYFNVDGEQIAKNHNYALYTSPTMNQLYNNLVGNEFFVSQVGESATFAYEKIEDEVFTNKKLSLMAYTVPPKVLKPTVEYKLNGKSLGKKGEMPYTIEVDFNQLGKGSHKLHVEVYDGTKPIGNKEYEVIVNDTNVEIRSSKYLAENVFTKLNLPRDVQRKMSNGVVLFVGSAKSYAKGKETLVDLTNPQVKPVIKGSRTLVPVRFISEALGATVGWDGATSSITVRLGDTLVKLALGSKNMVVNDQVSTLDVAAETIDGRTFIPLRALTEALGKEVFFDRNLIIISDEVKILDSQRDKGIIDKLIGAIR